MDKNDINASKLPFENDVLAKFLPKQKYFYVHYSSFFLPFTVSSIQINVSYPCS